MDASALKCHRKSLCYAALTRAKQLVVVVGTWDALKLAVESERSDQRMSTLQQRISSLAVRAGAAANQKMVSYAGTAKPSPQQQPSKNTGQRQLHGSRYSRQAPVPMPPAQQRQPAQPRQPTFAHAQYAHTQSHSLPTHNAASATGSEL